MAKEDKAVRKKNKQATAGVEMNDAGIPWKLIFWLRKTEIAELKLKLNYFKLLFSILEIFHLCLV